MKLSVTKSSVTKMSLAIASMFFLTTESMADKNEKKTAEVAPAMSSQVDLKKSEFVWKADKKIGSGHHGNIALKSAKAEMEKGQIKSAEFVMDMTSFNVTDLQGEWKDKFLTHVKSGDFFEVEKHPEAKLVIEKQTGKDTVVGKLTIKEKTQPVTIKFQEKDGMYVGTLTFDRTKFGITYNSESIMSKVGADKIIKDEVKLDFKVAMATPAKK